MMGGNDERVLSYGDVMLRRSDVELLDGPNYLNDHVIEFFFNYLQRQYCCSGDSEGLGGGGAEEGVSPLLLVGPSLTFWLLHSPDEEGLMSAIDPLRLTEREMVIFALNNNEDVETAEGGTHWTLLMFNRTRNTFEHFDSMAGMNWKQAREFVSIIKPFMGPGVLPAKLIEQATPQQENSYDCGVYVMAVAQVLCVALHQKKRNRPHDFAGLVRTQVTPSSVNRMRYTTLELISSLSAGENSPY